MYLYPRSSSSSSCHLSHHPAGSLSSSLSLGSLDALSSSIFGIHDCVQAPLIILFLSIIPLRDDWLPVILSHLSLSSPSWMIEKEREREKFVGRNRHVISIQLDANYSQRECGILPLALLTLSSFLSLTLSLLYTWLSHLSLSLDSLSLKTVKKEIAAIIILVFIIVIMADLQLSSWSHLTAIDGSVREYWERKRARWERRGAEGERKIEAKLN